MIDQTPKTSYDAVPYPDLSHSNTHPEYLAALATLLGMTPGSAAHCRVLELGTAGGWNLLPMAANLPTAHFVGIDNSQNQIAAAQADALALGLDNVTFHQMDILDIDADFGEFDYIIAHGVYSWVPAEVRDKIMAICQQNLAPQGIAYISYNTYPGWHMMQMVREMQLYHIRELEDPMQRASAARTFAQFMADSVPANEAAYKSFFDFYLDLRSSKSKDIEHLYASILHDELSPVNEPLYFSQFAAHAAHYDLQFLAETDFPSSILSRWPQEVVDYVQRSASTPLEVEQYLDFLHNRSHRMTLLGHADSDLDRQLKPERIMNMLIATAAQPVAESLNQPVAQFKSSNKAVFSTNHPITREAMLLLTEVAPQAVAFETLLASASRRLGIAEPTDEDRQVLAGSLLRGFCYSSQLVTLHTYQPTFTAEISDYPCALRSAARQAERQNIVTNVWHERVLLEGISQPLLALLDGEHNFEALLNIFIQMAEAGQMGLQEEGRLITDPARIRESLHYELEMTLRWLARSALLVG